MLHCKLPQEQIKCWWRQDIKVAFDIFGGLFEGGAGAFGILGTMFWVILITVPALAFIFFFFYWLYKKRMWNLDVEIKLPRSDGKLIGAEWGKGAFDIKRGIVFIKRRKKRKVPMKPFQITKYLQGERILSVVQTGPDTYKPILNESWTEMENDEPLRDEHGKITKDGEGNPIHEKAALLSIKVDTTESKSWKNYCEREGKAAFSIMSLLREYAPYIGTAMILVANFVGFAILWAKVK